MLSNKTIHTFLNSASNNMSKTEFISLAEHLKSLPGLENAVLEAKKQIREKQIRIFTRKVDAQIHLADRLENARAATYRAIECHNHAQEALRQKMEISNHAKNRRQERVYDLGDQMRAANNEANKLRAELEAMKLED